MALIRAPAGRPTAGGTWSLTALGRVLLTLLWLAVPGLATAVVAAGAAEGGTTPVPTPLSRERGQAAAQAGGSEFTRIATGPAR